MTQPSDLNSSSSAAIVPQYRLDVRGESCPYPAINTLEALGQMRAGEVLEVVSDCAQSINNIPHDARNHGHEMLEVTQDGPLLRFLIRRG